MPQEELVVKGYREFLRATDRAGKESKRYVRGTFRQVGDIIREDATQRMMAYSSVSAAGYRTSVRVTGIRVDQSLRKTTGQRPDWGALQMKKALLPALYEKRPAVERAFAHALDKVADHFDH